MRNVRTWLFGVCLFGMRSLTAAGVTIEWLPVDADGPHTINGNQIVLEGGGQVVTLEVRVSNWDPDQNGDPQVGTAQATVDAAGYSSGAGDPLSALTTPTPGDGAFQALKLCHFFDGVGLVPTQDRCSSNSDCPGTAPFCVDNPEFIFAGILSQASVSTSTANYAWGAVSNPGICASDDGSSKYYLGTLRLVVPVAASGTYTIGFDPDNNSSFLNNCDGTRLQGLVFTPATITLACATDEQCADGNECTDDVCDQGVCTNPPEASGTACGSASNTACDNPDTCDGAGTCQPNFELPTMVCRPAVGACNPAEFCTGDSPTCPANTFAPSGTACGSSGDTECDDPDTCDGAGVCRANPASPGTPCGDPTDTECNGADACDGNGVCEDNILPAGATCGDTSSSECNDPDTCDGAGNCLTNVKPAGLPCGNPIGTQCDEPDSCDGAGTCQPHPIAAGTPCGNPGMSACDNRDECDGAGVCDANHVADGTPCTDDGNQCRDDVCSSGVCAHPLKPVGTACGDSTDTECDNPDSCDGTGTCQANREPAGAACGDPASTDCDGADSCNGSGVCLQNIVPAGTACGDQTDTDCDNPDTCNGAGTCLTNVVGAGIPCGNQVGNQCDEPDTCDGAGACEPNFIPAGTPCGSPGDTQCDNPDSCNGSGTCSPNREPDGTLCADDGNQCRDDVCLSGVCVHPVSPAGTPCGNQTATDCNNPDTCNGTGTCVSNLVSAGTPCGDQSDTVCTDPDTCNGTGTCLANHAPDGTNCDDGSFCNQGAMCVGGQCAGGSGVDCDDGLACTADSCNEAAQDCDNILIAGNCLIDGACYLDGEFNPANSCEFCDAAGDPFTWAFVAAGTPCDDGDPCTGTGEPGIGIDTCDANGVCSGTVDPDCNDDCINAVEVFDGSNIGNNENRGPDDEEALCQFDSNNDIWFFYVATCTGLVVMDTEGSAFLPFNDTVLSVYDACGGTEIACDDDGGTGLLSTLSFSAADGATYWIRVAGFQDNAGDLVLNITTLDGCVIEEICYSPGEPNPANECEVCIPLLAATSWSPASAGTPCGDPTETDCDSPDACDGTGACDINHKSDFELCLDDGNDCTDDVCFGGACSHPAKAVGTACGDPTVTECDNADTCDGAGTCLSNFVALGQSCGDPSTSDCDNADICDGAGACDPNHQPDATMCTDDGVECTFDECTAGFCLHPPRPSGTSCGDGSNTQCDNPDTCDGTGMCLDNFEASGFACGDPTDTECDNPDSCDGAGECMNNHEPIGFACGDPADTDCDNPDSCDGGGACLDNLEVSGVPCGDGSNTQCDNPDTCDGTGVCLDNFEPAGLACGNPGTSDCDNADICDGLGACDPNHQPDGLACTDDGAECTFDECGGGICLHPPRLVGTPCGDPSNTQCDNPDTCDGVGVCADNFEPSGFTCGDPTNTDCDNPDSCDGAGLCVDNLEPPGFGCGSPADTGCDNPDTCNGAGTCLDNFEINGFPCGDTSNTQCDNPDTCDGTGTCLSNFEPLGLACGDPSSDQCDNPDQCDGLGACDPNFVAPGTACDDGDICTKEDACLSGLCVGTPIPEAPIVEAEGPKWLGITAQPPGNVPPIALHVTSPDWPCLDKYVGGVFRCGGTGIRCGSTAECNACNQSGEACLIDADCPFAGEVCLISGDACLPGTLEPIDVDGDGLPDGLEGALVEAADVEVLTPDGWGASLRRCSKSVDPCTVDTDCDRGVCVDPACPGGVCDDFLSPCSVAGQDCPGFCLNSLAGCVNAADCDPGDTCVLATCQLDESCVRGKVYVTGLALTPDATYEVVEECGSFVSAPGSDSTCPWCDVNCDGAANFADIQLQVLGFQGQLELATYVAADVQPCVPNRVVNFADIQWCVLAWQYAQTYSERCGDPCP